MSDLYIYHEYKYMAAKKSGRISQVSLYNTNHELLPKWLVDWHNFLLVIAVMNRPLEKVVSQEQSAVRKTIYPKIHKGGGLENILNVQQHLII